MISTNTNWDAKNALMAKQPIYAMEIAGQTTVYTTADLAAAGVTGTLPTYQPWLMTPQGAAQSIDPVQARSTLGELQCDVVDVGGAIRTLVGTTVLGGETLTLLAGWPGIAWSEFVVVQTYQIYKIVPASGYGRWTFYARDWQLLTKKTLAVHPENGGLLTQDNPWYLSGTPCEIVQALALYGLGLDAGRLDIDGIQALDSPTEGIYSPWRPFLFALTEPFTVLQFLETEIFKPSGLYAVVTPEGKISLRSWRPPAAGVSPVFAFDQDNMTKLPEIDRLEVVNEVVFRYDYDGSAYEQEVYFLEATSLTTYGRTTQWVVESKGLRSEWGAYGFAQWAAGRLFRRLAGTPTGLRGGAPVLDIEAFLMTLPVWVGDLVTLTHPLMPDLMTGRWG